MWYHTNIPLCFGACIIATNTFLFIIFILVPTPSVIVNDDTANVGSSIDLTCTPTVPGGISVTYTYSWSPLTDNDNMLNINPVTTNNAGRHTCTVTASYSGSNVNVLNSDPSVGYGYLTVRGKSNECIVYYWVCVF